MKACTRHLLFAFGEGEDENDPRADFEDVAADEGPDYCPFCGEPDIGTHSIEKCKAESEHEMSCYYDSTHDDNFDDGHQALTDPEPW